MTDNSELVKNFATLFTGRTDAYGSWEGGCVKQPVTQGLYSKHLWGQEYVGIYPMMDDSMVWWGCSDIDVNDIDQARNIQLALKLKLIESWVERTVKGFHVWVFAREPVEARVMRRALLAAHAAVKVPAKEINPKQEEASGYGNYVRLPYPGALFEPSAVRYMIDSSDKPLSLETFVNEAMTYAVIQKDLEPLANAYVPKTSIRFNGDGRAIPMDVAKTLLSPYTLKMFMEGPLPDSDRSGTLVRLAYRLRSDGISPEMAYGIIRTADKTWGKFYEREDGEMHLSKIIADVYGE
jgi:hypothetical protein